MGKLLQRLKASSGEASLHSALGRWRAEVSSVLDDPDTVVVHSLGDFPPPVGGVISLSPSTCYDIHGMIDLLGNKLRLAQNTVIHGQCSPLLDGLIRTAETTPLLDNVPGASVAIQGISLSHLAGGSPFEFTDSGMPGCFAQVSVTDSNLLGNSAPGIVDGVCQAVIARLQVQGATGIALLMRGHSEEVIIGDVVGLNNLGALTLISADAGSDIDNFVINRVGDKRDNAGSVSLNLDGLGTTGHVFVEGNILIGLGISATATTVTRRALPTWQYSNNHGLAASLVTCENKFALTTAGALTPPAIPGGTWQDIPATYAFTLSATTQRFTQAGDGGRVEYTGDEPAEVRLLPVVSAEAASGTQRMGLTVNINGSDIAAAETTTEIGTTAATFSTIHQVTVNPGDLIKIRLRNNTGAVQFRFYSANLSILGLG